MKPAANWALVPVKRRSACKSRLEGTLSAAARLALVRGMLDHVIGCLRQAANIGSIACVSEERDGIPDDLLVLPDPGTGLNAALADARERLRQLGARQILVLPADLPLLSPAEVDALTTADTPFALVSDRAGVGTNALWLPAQADFRFQFGPGSRQLHLEEARRCGWRPALPELPGFAFDIDGPEDLAALRARGEMFASPCTAGLKEFRWDMVPRTRCA